MFVKRFLEWVGVKERLDMDDHKPPLMSEGELWWCAIGENVGVEVCGKGQRFTRPVIILKKFGRSAFFGIPTTTKKREGTWYSSFSFKETQETALLSQARLFSYKRLDRKMGTLDELDYEKVKEAFLSLFSE